MSDLRLPVGIQDELTSYFATAESDFGVSSTFGAFINMIVRGGPSGSPNQEGQIRDERYGLGNATGSVTRARRVYAALRQCPASTTVLYAAHGPIDWGKLIDSAFGRGMAAKVMGAIGQYPGVALLTETVRAGWAATQAEVEARRSSTKLAEHLLSSRARRPPPCRWKDRPKAWENEGGWLAATVVAKDARALKAIRREVDVLLADAWAAYARARGVRLESEAEQRRARRKPRTTAPVARGERIHAGETPWS